MKITGISEEPHKRGLYRVAVDGKPVGYVEADDVLELRLAVNQEIDSLVYGRLVGMVKQASFYSVALTYADRRLHSKAEIKTYLLRKGCEAKNTDKIISKLEALGIIDEQKLAEAYVHDATMQRPMSKLALGVKLRKKYLPTDAIESALAGAEFDDTEALDNLIKRKKSLSAYKDNQPRLFRYLLSQGFSYRDIAERIGSPKVSGSNRRRDGGSLTH
jgi:regulatory protein